MQDSTGARAPGRQRASRLRPALVHLCASLRAQIVLLVLFTTGITALLAAWTSTNAIERFLERRIEDRFPALLLAKDRELRLWYQDLEQGLATFAGSETVTQNVPRLVAGHDTTVARDELGDYLGYIIRRFPKYRALFLVGRNGRRLLQVGRKGPLPAGAVDAGIAGPRLGGIVRVDGQRMQFAAAPVRGAKGVTLHALVDLSALDGKLASGVERAATRVFLFDANGDYVAGSLAKVPRRFSYHGPAPGAATGVATYRSATGARVVGAARRIDPFGWTLAIEQDYEAAFEPVGALIKRVFWVDVGIGLLLILVAGRLALSVVRPVRALSAVAGQVAAGETDVDLPPPRGASELAALTRAFNQMTHRLQANRAELERNNAELERLSVTDGLTGAFNHRYFRTQLPGCIERAAETGRQLGLIVFDIDDFKAINDTHGHTVGDDTLRTVARVMDTAVAGHDLLARYGGEEFVVLTAQPDADGAVALAERIRTAIENTHCAPEGGDAAAPAGLALTVSAGIALYDGDQEALFQAADNALYQAKRQGKNRVVMAGADRQERPSTGPRGKRAGLGCR